MKLVCSRINRKSQGNIRYSNLINTYHTSLEEFLGWDSKFNSFNVLDFEQFLPQDVQIKILKQRINKLLDRI